MSTTMILSINWVSAQKRRVKGNGGSITVGGNVMLTCVDTHTQTHAHAHAHGQIHTHAHAHAHTQEPCVE